MFPLSGALTNDILLHLERQRVSRCTLLSPKAIHQKFYKAFSRNGSHSRKEINLSGNFIWSESYPEENRESLETENLPASSSFLTLVLKRCQP